MRKGSAMRIIFSTFRNFGYTKMQIEVKVLVCTGTRLVEFGFGLVKDRGASFGFLIVSL